MPKLPPTSERRRFQRYRVHLQCELHFDKQRIGLVRDISRTGLFVHTTARPSPGTQVDVIFPEAGAFPEVRVSGVVVRIDQSSLAPNAEAVPTMTGGVAIEASLAEILGELIRRARAKVSD